jgi:pyridoxal 5'-phosphate synthase pdxS subunit
MVRHLPFFPNTANATGTTESEVLTMADDKHHISKHPFKVPFVCGAKDLGEALRRISEGASMVRSKGEAGSGNVVE